MVTLACARGANAALSAFEKAAAWQPALALLRLDDAFALSCGLRALAEVARWQQALAFLWATEANVNAVVFGAAITACAARPASVVRVGSGEGGPVADVLGALEGDEGAQLWPRCGGAQRRRGGLPAGRREQIRAKTSSGESSRRWPASRPLERPSMHLGSFLDPLPCFEKRSTGLRSGRVSALSGIRGPKEHRRPSGS